MEAMTARFARQSLILSLLCLGLAMTYALPGRAAETDFTAWLEGVKFEALRRGISEKTLASTLTGIRPIPRVVELDRKQPEFTLSFNDYMARVVPAKRVRKARKKFGENHAILVEIGKKYGVQPRFIVALWGIESDFGRLTGGFKVIPALATLAFDGRRSAYFRKELFNALTIVDQGHISAKRMTGSWAGAMGQSQFMPSSFLNHAVDYDGDGRRDIWRTTADVFASAANYLARVGWKGDQNWGRQVNLPAGFKPSLVGLKVVKRLREWNAIGVRRTDGSALPSRNLRASVMLPGGVGGPAFLVYNNYRSILKWNRSHFFATAVGKLADRIGRR